MEPLKCKVCQHISSDSQSFFEHFDLSHRVGPHSNFLCGVVSCSLNFKSLDRYERHYNDFHCLQDQTQVVQEGSSGESFKCALCDYECTNKSTLRGHRKRKHCGETNCGNEPDKTLVHSDVSEAPEIIIPASMDEDEETINVTNAMSAEPESSASDVLSKKILHFYLTLSSTLHIPEKTIQFMIESYRTFAKASSFILKENLVKSMVTAGMDYDKSCGMVNDAFENDVFLEMHSSTGPIRSTHIRKKNYFRNFKFVKPESRKLGLNENNEVRKFHTVSIEESIQSLLDDDAIYEQYIQSQNYVPSAEYYKDIHDGSLLSSHPVLSTDPTAIAIMFYEDDVELVNPLGSAKCVHKLTTVEYTLSFLKPWCRMKKDGLQIALLCAEKDVAYFGLSKVLEPLVEELKTLEEVGIMIRGKMVKVVPVMLLGDNLGTHTFTGFVENFSKSTHFCRYCEESRAEWRSRWQPDCHEEAEDSDEAECEISSDEETTDDSDSEGEIEKNKTNEDIPIEIGVDEEVEDEDLPEMPYNTANLRTPQSFDECVKKVQKCKSYVHYKGVVGECELNKLKNFHCIGASPPCLPHDCFEGIIAYDVPLILNYLMEKFGISEDYINRKIKSLKLLGTDREDRPAKITAKMKKLHGNAIQNWNFLRFLPFYIGSKVTDRTDKVWKMLLLLIELTRILCSPSLLRNIIPVVRQKIHRYLTMRVCYFPNTPLRPKHHFYEHFSYLLTVFGNLMRVSTLAFESKHRFFKDTVAKKKNFKNITKTLTMEHQLARSAHSVDTLVSTYPTVENGLSLHSIILPDDISAHLTAFFGPQFLNSAAFSEKVSFHGTSYSKGTAVVAYSGSSQKLEMCLIETLIVKGTDCYAAGEWGL